MAGNSTGGLKTYSGDAFRGVRETRTRRQLERMQASTGTLNRTVFRFGGLYEPIGRQPGGKMVLVRVQQDGGSAGSETVKCSFTYAIYPDSDVWATLDPLDEMLTPEKARAPIGAYLAATSGSRGLATRGTDGWILLQAYDEVESVGC